MPIRRLARIRTLGALLALPVSVLALNTHECTVLEVAAFANRVHVLCKDDYQEGSGFYGIRYFAVPTRSSGEAAHLTTLESTALSGAGVLTFDFDLTNGVAGTDGGIAYNCRCPLNIRLNT